MPGSRWRLGDDTCRERIAWVLSTDQAVSLRMRLVKDAASITDGSLVKGSG
jgi:hypothetical protein